MSGEGWKVKSKEIIVGTFPTVSLSFHGSQVLYLPVHSPLLTPHIIIKKKPSFLSSL